MGWLFFTDKPRPLRSGRGAATNSTESGPSLMTLMEEADPEHLEALRLVRAQQEISEETFRDAVKLLPRKGPSLAALMEQADPEQLKALWLVRAQEGMSEETFRDAVKLLPRKGPTPQN